MGANPFPLSSGACLRVVQEKRASSTWEGCASCLLSYSCVRTLASSVQSSSVNTLSLEIGAIPVRRGGVCYSPHSKPEGDSQLHGRRERTLRAVPPLEHPGTALERQLVRPNGDLRGHWVRHGPFMELPSLWRTEHLRGKAGAVPPWGELSNTGGRASGWEEGEFFVDTVSFAPGSQRRSSVS